MYCEFSETQFVFGILNELVTRCWTPKRAWSAPTLPTQREELKLGYDFKIEGPVRTLFFQFKVPEKIITPRGKHWKEFGEPYYKFKIWPDDKTHQHNLLVELANKDPHNWVYYCAPRFHTEKEFGKNYLSQKISEQSIYIPCGKLNKISGSDQHEICYTRDPTNAPIMFSKPYPVDALDVEGLKRDAEGARPYEDIGECLSRIEEKFSIYARGAETAVERFHQIANQLLMRENLNLLLLGQ